MYSDMSKRTSALSLPNRKRGQRARQLGLADAGRAEEDEAADRPVRVLQAGARPADRARERRDRLVLADDAPVQRRPPSAAACRPRPALIDASGTPVHFETTSSISGLPTTTCARDLTSDLATDRGLARRRLLLAVELRLLEVLLRTALSHRSTATRMPRRSRRRPRWTGVAQLGARAGLVDEVDRLVGQEPVGDVAARLVDRRLDRLARVLDVVERLVAVLDADQDLDRLAPRPAARP